MDSIPVKVEMIFTTPAFVFKDGAITTSRWITVQQGLNGKEIMHFIGKPDDLMAAGIIQPKMRLEGRKRKKDGDRWNVTYWGCGMIEFVCW